MINFLSLNDMFLISLHGNPIFGVSLYSNKKSKYKNDFMGKRVIGSP